MFSLKCPRGKPFRKKDVELHYILIFSSNSIPLFCVILYVQPKPNNPIGVHYVPIAEFHYSMKKILVPIDLRSDFSNLIDYAIAVARRSDARMVVYYAGGRRFLKQAGNYTYACEESDQSFLDLIRNSSLKGRTDSLLKTLRAHGIKYDFLHVSRGTVADMVMESETGYDLLIMGTSTSPGIRGYVQSAYASRLIGEVNIPVLLVPVGTRYDEIGHITYAVDLTDYDPHVIQQVKGIAAMFDAKLTIAHVNPQEEVEKEQYLSSLERTITDTLDYPKVFYKFFDHADTVSGIKKFVQFNDTNVVAMINRKRFSWSDIFSDKSLTRKMSRELQVPLLAFGKYSA